MRKKINTKSGLVNIYLRKIFIEAILLILVSSTAEVFQNYVLNNLQSVLFRKYDGLSTRRTSVNFGSITYGRPYY